MEIKGLRTDGEGLKDLIDFVESEENLAVNEMAETPQKHAILVISQVEPIDIGNGICDYSVDIFLKYSGKGQILLDIAKKIYRK